MNSFRNRPWAGVGLKNMIFQFMGVVFMVVSAVKENFIVPYGRTMGIVTCLALAIIGACMFVFANGLKHLEKVDSYYHKFIYGATGIVVIGYLVYLFLL